MIINDVLLYILVFFVALSLDYVRGKYIKAVQRGKAIKAASLSSIIIVSSFFIASNYMDHKGLIVPVMLGGSIGTYYSVKNGSSK